MRRPEVLIDLTAQFGNFWRHRASRAEAELDLRGLDRERYRGRPCDLARLLPDTCGSAVQGVSWPASSGDTHSPVALTVVACKITSA